MSTREPDSEESADLIISGHVGALRDLVEPPPLSELQLKIIHWYEHLSRPLAGPRSGNDRGPAQQPFWTKQGPRIESVELCDDTERKRLEFLVEGSGLASTTEVWVDGRPVGGWQVLSPGRLVIPVPAELRYKDEPEVDIEVRTPEGNVVVRTPPWR